MPTKEELRRLVDQLPDEPTTGELQALYQAISTAVATVGAPEQDDTATLTGLSSSALLRDWASDEDRVYDDDEG